MSILLRRLQMQGDDVTKGKPALTVKQVCHEDIVDRGF